MPDNQDLRFAFDHVNKLVIILEPTVSMSIQEIWDAIAFHRAQPDWIDDAEIARSEGKINIPGLGDSLIVLTMLDGWRIKFEDRPGPDVESLEITAGVLVGDGGANPLAPTAFGSVFLAQAVSGASIQQPKIDEIHQMLGLLAGSPMIESPTGRSSSAGTAQESKNISQTFTPNAPVDGAITLERDT
jgi:hypothetical protein